MPVTNVHRLYAERSKQWTRCRDAFEGTDAVKGAGTTYLPKLGGQTTKDYDAYKARALWFGATARTVHGLTGSVMRKEPEASGPEQLLTHLDDVTLTGVPLKSFSQQVTQEVLSVGRAGVLLDLPAVGVPGTIARPYWVLYSAEQIINWKMRSINGIPTLTLVVLKEEYEGVGADDFSGDCITQYRVLRLEGTQYKVEIYRAEKQNYKNAAAPVLAEESYPQLKGESVGYIPFVFVNPLSMDPTPVRPPLLDLVDVNFSHYLSSADLEHGRHFTALPTPYITGVAKEKSFSIGSSTAWCIPSSEAKIGMLEFTGQGLQSLENATTAKEAQMTVLGARMLEEQKAAVESSDTHRMRNAGETSLLAAISETISGALTRVARWHAEWISAKSDPQAITLKLNKDFGTQGMTSGELAELVKAWQSNAISYDTLYWNMKQGEITRPGVESEDERSLIDVQNPEPGLSLEDEDEETAPRPGVKPKESASSKADTRKGAATAS